MTSHELLTGRTIIVTGAATGIGQAFALGCAAQGAHVVVADMNPAEETMQAIAAAGAQATYVQVDVSDEASTRAMAQTALAATGRIDGLINNAALFANLQTRPFWEIDDNEWDAVMAVNVRGPFLLAKAVAPHMIERKSGKIVNIASGTVFKGQTGITHYVSSKGAIVAFTRCLARELGEYNINVNSIAPGLTMSEGVVEAGFLTGRGADATKNTRAFKREQVPADLVGTMVFLCSSDSDFMTGQTLVCDGGSVMR